LDHSGPFVIGKSFEGSPDEVEFVKNRLISASDAAALWMAGPTGRCLDGPRLKKGALSFGLAMEYTAAMPAGPYVVIHTMRNSKLPPGWEDHQRP
jgi:hypothetical protein